MEGKQFSDSDHCSHTENNLAASIYAFSYMSKVHANFPAMAGTLMLIKCLL